MCVGRIGGRKGQVIWEKLGCPVPTPCDPLIRLLHAWFFLTCNKNELNEMPQESRAFTFRYDYKGFHAVRAASVRAGSR